MFQIILDKTNNYQALKASIWAKLTHKRSKTSVSPLQPDIEKLKKEICIEVRRAGKKLSFHKTNTGFCMNYLRGKYIHISYNINTSSYSQ